MKMEINIDEIKKIAIQGLCLIKEICDKNNIDYFLGYGTLIGAVRHNGFIPWDDDIDIWMKRKDYDKFVEICKKNNDKEWELLICSENSKYLFPWAKFCNKKTYIEPSRFLSGLTYGISIDVFPLDYLEADNLIDAKNELEYKNKKFKFLFKNYTPFSYNSSIRKSTFKYIYKKMNYSIKTILNGQLTKKYEDIIQSSIGINNGKYVACISSLIEPPVFEAEWFNNECKLKFEDNYYSCPSKYDLVLKTLYGNYMKFPPEHERKVHHNYRAFKEE